MRNKGLSVFLIAGLLLILFVSCGISTEDLAKQVQDSMRQEWAARGENVRIINELTLVKRTNNEYRGVMTVTDGYQTQQWSVNVVVDNKNFIWTVESWTNL